MLNVADPIAIMARVLCVCVCVCVCSVVRQRRRWCLDRMHSTRGAWIGGMTIVVGRVYRAVRKSPWSGPSLASYSKRSTWRSSAENPQTSLWIRINTHTHQSNHSLCVVKVQGAVRPLLIVIGQSVNESRGKARESQKGSECISSPPPRHQRCDG